jgi:protein gp37
MGQTTHIQWCDHTFSPWQGCTKVSPGCANCYAEARNKRFSGGKNWGKGAPRLLKKDWSDPLRWNRSAGGSPARPKVFCASLADWLDDEVPIEWLARLLKLIHDTPNLDWLLLTKRPQNFFSRVDAAYEFSHGETWQSLWTQGEPPHNVWLGTSVEDQKRADERIPQLLNIPARIRFLSVEPMLGAIDLSGFFWRNPEPPCADCPKNIDCECGYRTAKENGLPSIDWVIFGGESGPRARPCNIEWIRDGVQQCRAAGVAPFVKQLGSFPCIPVAGMQCTSDWAKWRARLADSKGGDPSEWPADLRVREFPSTQSTKSTPST